jgi:hypothetical protein
MHSLIKADLKTILRVADPHPAFEKMCLKNDRFKKKIGNLSSVINIINQITPFVSKCVKGIKHLQI